MIKKRFLRLLNKEEKRLKQRLAEPHQTIEEKASLHGSLLTTQKFLSILSQEAQNMKLAGVISISDEEKLDLMKERDALKTKKKEAKK